MKVGDLIYDSAFGMNGIIIEGSEDSSFMIVFYEDGEIGTVEAELGPEVEVIRGC